MEEAAENGKESSHSAHADEWMNEWMNEWINEWVNEWYVTQRRLADGYWHVGGELVPCHRDDEIEDAQPMKEIFAVGREKRFRK